MITSESENELLENAAVLNFVQRCDESCDLILPPEIPLPVSTTYDMCNPRAEVVILDSLKRLTSPELEVIRVTGYPKKQAGTIFQLTLAKENHRQYVVSFGL